jgi:hypothetical protein
LVEGFGDTEGGFGADEEGSFDRAGGWAAPFGPLAREPSVPPDGEGAIAGPPEPDPGFCPEPLLGADSLV